MELPEGFSNCRYIFTLSGVLDPMSFALGVQSTEVVSPSVMAAQMYDAFQEIFVIDAGALVEGWTFVGTSVTRTVGGEPVIGEKIEPITSSSSVDGTIVNTAILVRKNTAAGGRKNRGRMFVPPFDLQEEVINSAGVISPSEVTDYQIKWELYRTALDTANLVPFLYHSGIEDAPTPIESFTVQSLAATQRRRMR